MGQYEARGKKMTEEEVDAMPVIATKRRRRVGPDGIQRGLRVRRIALEVVKIIESHVANASRVWVVRRGAMTAGMKEESGLVKEIAAPMLQLPF